MRSHCIFLGLISLMLFALAVAGHDAARTAPFILRPDIPLVRDRQPASFEIEPIALGEIIPESAR